MGHFLQQSPLSPGQESPLYHAWAEHVLLGAHRTICQTQAKFNTGLHSTKTPIRSEWSLESSDTPPPPPWPCHIKKQPVGRGSWSLHPVLHLLWATHTFYSSPKHSLSNLPSVQWLGLTLSFRRQEGESALSLQAKKAWKVPSASFAGMMAASTPPGTCRHVGGHRMLSWWLKGLDYH